MHCEECSAHKGGIIYLRNITKKKGGRSLCHIKHHNKFFSKKYLAEQALLKEQRKQAANAAVSNTVSNAVIP